jgi:hypothetical protein
MSNCSQYMHKIIQGPYFGLASTVCHLQLAHLIQLGWFSKLPTLTLSQEDISVCNHPSFNLADSAHYLYPLYHRKTVCVCSQYSVTKDIPMNIYVFSYDIHAEYGYYKMLCHKGRQNFLILLFWCSKHNNLHTHEKFSSKGVHSRQENNMQKAHEEEKLHYISARFRTLPRNNLLVQLAAQWGTSTSSA